MSDCAGMSGNFHLGDNFVIKSMSGVCNVFRVCTLPRTFVKSKRI